MRGARGPSRLRSSGRRRSCAIIAIDELKNITEEHCEIDLSDFVDSSPRRRIPVRRRVRRRRAADHGTSDVCPGSDDGPCGNDGSGGDDGPGSDNGPGTDIRPGGDIRAGSDVRAGGDGNICAGCDGDVRASRPERWGSSRPDTRAGDRVPGVSQHRRHHRRWPQLGGHFRQAADAG